MSAWKYVQMRKLLDIEMLIMTQGGREPMADEFQALLAAGLRLIQIVSTGAPHSIIESRPELGCAAIGSSDARCLPER
jgi:hypothetical protein